MLSRYHPVPLFPIKFCGTTPINGCLHERVNGKEEQLRIRD